MYTEWLLTLVCSFWNKDICRIKLRKLVAALLCRKCVSFMMCTDMWLKYVFMCARVCWSTWYRVKFSAGMADQVWKSVAAAVSIIAALITCISRLVGWRVPLFHLILQYMLASLLFSTLQLLAY